MFFFNLGCYYFFFFCRGFLGWGGNDVVESLLSDVSVSMYRVSEYEFVFVIILYVGFL